MKPDIFWIPGPWRGRLAIVARPRGGDWLDDERFVSFPIPDRGTPASTRDALALITTVASDLENGKNVAVHCRQGVGRSGLVAAGVLMSAGTNPEKALQVVSSARGTAVPETLEQRLWLRQLPTELLVGKG